MVVRPREGDRFLVLVIGRKSCGIVVGCEDDKVPPLPLAGQENVVIGEEPWQLGRSAEERVLERQDRLMIDTHPCLSEEPDRDGGDGRRDRLGIRNDEQVLVPGRVAPASAHTIRSEPSPEGHAHRLEHDGVATGLGRVREPVAGDDVVRPEYDRAHVSPGREARRRTSPPCGA